jgi:hypothetical protein
LANAPFNIAGSAAAESLPQIGNNFWKTHF